MDLLIFLLLNILCHATIKLLPYVCISLSELPSPTPAMPPENICALHRACSAAAGAAREKLEKFIHSLERRLTRDIQRVYEYYETMKHELRQTIAKKSKVSSDAPGPEGAREIEKLNNKIAAIQTEQEWKVKDLVSKYAVKIQIAPLAAIHIKTSSTIFVLEIKRRLGIRRFSLCFNPLTRQLDSLPCESCFSLHASHYICDDELHILCPVCFARCPKCQRQFCPVCHATGCPQCRR